MIPNGVDVEHFAHPRSSEELTETKKEIGKNEGDIILASSSRLIGKNGLDDVIRSLKFLPKHIKFFNWGVGPDKKMLLALAQELELGDRVKLFEHPGDSLPKYFQASDIFIRPSLSEGFGISFLEGMAAGIPVTATPVGGIVDFLFDPDANPDKLPTGLFVPVKNPRLIAFQVQKLMNDRVLRDKIVINAKRMVLEKYDWNLVAEEMKKRVFYSTVSQ